MGRIRYYAAVTPEPNYLMNAILEYILPVYRHMAILLAFNFFEPKRKKLKTLFPGLSKLKAERMMDSGTFAARYSSPYLFTKHLMDDVAEYYDSFPFTYIIEPDVIPDYYGTKKRVQINRQFAIDLQIQRSEQLQLSLDQENPRTMIRPIQGWNTKQRIEYLKGLEKHLNSVEYIALGGLKKSKLKSEDLDDFRETLAELKSMGKKRIHFFGRSTDQFLQLAIEHKDNFEEITLDSSSFFKSAKGARKVWLPGEDEKTKKPTIKQYTFAKSAKRVPEGILDRLRNCECAVCKNPVLGKEEFNRIYKLDELGLASQTGEQTKGVYFIHKAALHNLCMYGDHLEKIIGGKFDD